MENELTQGRNNRYPVMRNTMDENLDIDRGTRPMDGVHAEPPSLEQKPIMAEQKGVVQEAWEEGNIRFEEKGEKITDEEREAQRQLIEMGRAPIGGGSGDGVFENFNADKYAGTQLEDLARRLREAGQNNAVSRELMEEIQETLNDLSGLGNEALVRQFTQDFNTTQQPQERQSEQRVENGGSANNFEKFNVELFEGTVLFESAKRMREAAERGASIEEMRQLMVEINDSWLDEHGRVKNEYSFELTQKFRDEYSFRLNQDAVARSLRNFEGLQSRESSSAKNIQQVAKQIMIAEGEDRWGVEGTYPLLTEDNKINQANFIRWARERIIYHHSNNSRDAQLQLPGLIGIDNPITSSTISVFAMEKNRGQYFKDALTGEVLEGLADQLKMEIWLFGSMRNYDLVYKQYMGSDEKLPEFLANVHSKEELTSGDSFERILKMSDNFGEGDTKVGDAFRKAYMLYYYISDYDMLKKQLGDDSHFFTRQGMEDALRIMGKLDKGEVITLDKLEPQYHGIFNLINSCFNDAGELNEARFIHAINPFNAQDKNDIQVQFSRELIKRAIADQYGLEYGLDKSKNPGRTPNGAIQAPERQFARMNLEYAETWAWVLTSLTGAAARNDVEGIGFDAQTKYIKFLRSRRRQTATNRAGAYGNKYNMGVHKQLTEDFFNGIFIQEGPEDQELTQIKADNGISAAKRKSPFELMVELGLIETRIKNAQQAAGLGALSEKEIGDLKEESLTDEQQKVKRLVKMKKDLATVRFDQRTQIGYIANHISRATSIFHGLMGGKEIRLDQLVKWQQTGLLQGKWVVDHPKFEGEFKEELIKAYRYAYSTHGSIDFGEIIRVEDLTQNGNNDQLPKWKNVVRADAYFGPIVTGELKKTAFEDYKKRISVMEEGSLTEDQKKWLKGNRSEELELQVWSQYVRDNRGELWKRALLARVAKDLFAHRVKSKRNKYEYMGPGQVDAFIQALESIQEEEILVDSNDELVFKTGKPFISKEEMDWFRAHSRTGKTRLAAEYMAPVVGEGLLGGIWEGLKEFVSGVTK